MPDNPKIRPDDYNTLDPLGQIYAQGDLYRKASSIQKHQKKIVSYMAILFATLIFIMPFVWFSIVAIIAIKDKTFESINIYALLILLIGALVGYKIITASIMNLRHTHKHGGRL